MRADLGDVLFYLATFVIAGLVHLLKRDRGSDNARPCRASIECGLGEICDVWRDMFGTRKEPPGYW